MFRKIRTRYCELRARILTNISTTILLKAMDMHQRYFRELPKNTSKRWVSVDSEDEKYLGLARKILERRANHSRDA